MKRTNKLTRTRVAQIERVRKHAKLALRELEKLASSSLCEEVRDNCAEWITQLDDVEKGMDLFYVVADEEQS